MASFNIDELNLIISEVKKWAEKRADISGLALVGSYARGNPQEDSDIDFLIITSERDSYRENTVWVYEINWQIINANIQNLKDQDYGVVWSWRIYLNDNREIEMGFGNKSWADPDLIDSVSVNVIKNGFRIIYDPVNLLNNLLVSLQI